VDGSVHFPVEKVDACLSWEVCERHVVEDNPVVLGRELSKVVHVGNNEGILKAVGCPLSLSCVGSSVDEDNPEDSSEGECPIAIWVPVLEVDVSLDIISDEFDVSNALDLNSGDVNSLPESSCVSDALNDVFSPLGCELGLFE